MIGGSEERIKGSIIGGQPPPPPKTKIKTLLDAEQNVPGRKNHKYKPLLIPLVQNFHTGRSPPNAVRRRQNVSSSQHTRAGSR